MKTVKFNYVRYFCIATHYNSLNPLKVERDNINKPYHKIAMDCDAIALHKCNPRVCQGFLEAEVEVPREEEWRLRDRKY